MNDLVFAHIFDVLPSPYMVLDRELRYVSVNRAYEQAVLKQREELVGRQLFDLFPNEGESGRRLRASFAEVLETGEPDTIAFIPYEIPRPQSEGGGVEERYWTATHTPILDDDGAVAFIVQNTVDVTEIVRLKQASTVPSAAVPGELALLRNAREVEEAYQETRSESEEFRRLFRQAPGMIAVLQGPDHVAVFANDSYARFVGHRDVIGLPIREALPEVAGQGFFEMLDAVYADGKSFTGEGVRLLIHGEGDEGLSETFIDFTYNPIRDAEGRVTGVFVQGADRTDAIRAADRQRLLIDELNHRVKNTLSTVQSMARQSFRKLPQAQEARAAFDARILALSHAHNVLAERRWEAAGLRVLLRQELSPFPRSQVTMSGPEVHLTARSAIALSMVFHELAANAAAYGALSSDEGELVVSWQVAGEGAGRHLSIAWTETAGAPVSASPLVEGFGMRMLHRVVEGELSGTLSLDLASGGLICRIELALSEVEEFASTAA
ncbi:PAS domain-containing protein [Aurantimonas sp. DM33-3]|uniref:sensor histidine kinase n=1 Tax=Aurantimonas sp. DM33-3 TaxID=2766955 RepID=UPI001FEE636A|nr:PAS domain-containing protein [Aurantimonas sp. DM33-3]